LLLLLFRITSCHSTFKRDDGSGSDSEPELDGTRGADFTKTLQIFFPEDHAKLVEVRAIKLK